MATLCKTYPTPDAAREAVEQLQAAGVPAHDIRLLTGGVLHDIRREPVGGFAGPVLPDRPVGNYGNALRRRRQGRGAYAGDPDAQRQGSFADTDSDLIETADGHFHAADDETVRSLLKAAAITGRAAEDVVESLHSGRAIVLTEIV
jgi:hypothetical protein